MSEKISSELNFAPVVSNHSTVIYRTIAPQGVSSITPTATSTYGPVEFIIPPSVFRFDKSRLNFSILVGSSAAGFFNYVNANTLTTLSRVSLYDSATNALWADISNLNNYTSLVTPVGTDFKEYSTKSFVAGALQTTVANAQKYTVEDISKSNLLTVNDTGDNQDLAVQNPYFSRRQFYIGADNSATALDVSIPFSAFKLSVLSSEKLLYAPSNLVLQCYFNNTNNYAFQADVATDPTDGPVAVSSLAISNISLSLANEANLAIVSQVINKVMAGGGISLPIAYPTVTRQAIATATAHSFNLSLTRGYGNRILAMITAPFHTTTTLNTANVHARSTLSTFNTFLNNVPIKSASGFDATKSQDYIQANKEYLKDSAVQSLGEYYLGEWLHVDSFFGEKSLKDINQHEIDGLDVGTQSSTWQIQANVTGAGTAFNWVTIIVGQKQLTITNQGSMIQ
jgi:hypothetical protein